MDVRRHGDASWQSPLATRPEPHHPQHHQHHQAVVSQARTNRYTRAEGGKTEMSLVHFSLVNPGWKPPAPSGEFIAALREQVAREAEALPALAEEAAATTAATTDKIREENALYASLHSASGEASVGGGGGGGVREAESEAERAGALYASMAGELLGEARMAGSRVAVMRTAAATREPSRGDPPTSLMEEEEEESPPAVLATTGFADSIRGSLLASQFMAPDGSGSGFAAGGIGGVGGGIAGSSRMFGTLAPPPNLRQDLRRLGLEYTAADMSLSALYLHELHQRSCVGQQQQQQGQQQQQHRRAAYHDASRYDFQQQQQQQSDDHEGGGGDGQRQHYHHHHRRGSLNELDEENLPLLETGGASTHRLTTSR